MEKPVVFFSHSNADKLTLSKFREALLAKTANSVEIFLSSDGQSIRLGVNWVKRIEDALKQAKIMFVFLSPNALAKPSWIHFEAGYAYANDIRVIPVGIDGVDLGDLPPPLRLLQGFNIRNEEGANNVISVINEEFKLTAPEDFQPEDFAAIFAATGVEQNSAFGEVTYMLDRAYMEFTYPRNADGAAEWVRAIPSVLRADGTECAVKTEDGKTVINTYGIRIEFSELNDRTKGEVHVDPLVSRRAFETLDNLLGSLPVQHRSDLTVAVVFESGFEESDETQKITARIFGTGITLTPEGSYQYKGFLFGIGHYRWGTGRGPTYVRVNVGASALTDVPFGPLLEILVSKNVVTKSPFEPNWGTLG